MGRAAQSLGALLLVLTATTAHARPLKPRRGFPAKPRPATTREEASPAPAVRPAAPATPAARPTPLALPAGQVRVQFIGVEGALELELYGGRGTEGFGPVARCRTPCEVFVPLGRYRLVLEGSADTVDGESDLEVVQSTRVWITPETRAHLLTGGIVTAAGVALLIGSFALIGSIGGECDNASSSSCGDTASQVERRATYAGLALLGGLVAIPVGLGMVIDAHSPEVEQAPMPMRTGRGTTAPIGKRPQLPALGLRVAF